MTSEALSWTIAALAFAAALWLGLRLRARSGEAEGLAGKLAALEQRQAETAKRLEAREKSRLKHGSELDELRRKLDKVKRRAQRAQGEQRGEHARIVELEEELRLVRRERQTTIEELERLRSAQERDTPRTPDRAPAKPEPPKPAEPPPESEALKRRTQELADSESRAGKLAAELEKSRAEASRQRRRATTLDTAYTAQRGELEAKKDRLRTQQEELERLRALRVTFAAELSDAAAGGAEPATATPAEPEESIDPSGDAATSA